MLSDAAARGVGVGGAGGAGGAGSPPRGSYSVKETLEHFQPYAQTLLFGGSLVFTIGTFVKVISDIKADVSKLSAVTDEKFGKTDEKISKVQLITDEKFGKTDEKFGKTDEKISKVQSITDEKISKVQSTTDEKIKAVKAEAALEAANTYFKFNHDEQFASLRPKTSLPDTTSIPASNKRA